MTRILLVCPEPLGHGQPAGIGIRFLEMARALGDDGHAITLLDRDAVTPEALARASAGADMAVVQGHAANDFFAHARAIPTVIDLYDPFIVENLHYFASRGAGVFTHDHATLMLSLLRGDFFLCASAAQRLFYLGALLTAGRINPVIFESDPELHSLLAIAPFGVQPPRKPKTRDLGNPQVLFGGIYDWYDPIAAIDAVAQAREEMPGLSLTFNVHPNPSMTPQGKARDAVRYVTERGLQSFVRFEPWAEYEGRGEFLERFAAALLTFPQSLETDLAMRTRIYDYLWGGLPIVTSPAPGTDEILTRYGAGTVVHSSAARDFAGALVAAIRNHEAMAEGAQAFVADHQWPAVLEPLRTFCRAPKFDATKEDFAASMHVAARPSSIFDRLRRRIGGGS